MWVAKSKACAVVGAGKEVQMIVDSFSRRLKQVVDQLQGAAATGSWLAFQSAQTAAQHYEHLSALLESCEATFKQRQEALRTELDSAVLAAPVAIVEGLMLKGVDLGLPKQDLAQALETARQRDRAACDALCGALSGTAGFSVSAFESAAAVASGLGLVHQVAAASQELEQRRREVKKQMLQMAESAEGPAEVHAACAAGTALGMELEVAEALRMLQLRQGKAVAAARAIAAAAAEQKLAWKYLHVELVRLRSLGVDESVVTELEKLWRGAQEQAQQQLLQAAVTGDWEEFCRAEDAAWRVGLEDIQELQEQFQDRRAAVAQDLAASVLACCQCLELDTEQALELLQAAGADLQAFVTNLDTIAAASDDQAGESNENRGCSNHRAEDSAAGCGVQEGFGIRRISAEGAAAVELLARGVGPSMEPLYKALVVLQKQLHLANALELCANAHAACWALRLQCSKLIQQGKQPLTWTAILELLR
jgi:hypothetical protein